MKTYTQEQISQIPFYMKNKWYDEWIKEQNKPISYLGKLAILIQGKKIGQGIWLTEGIDFITQ